MKTAPVLLLLAVSLSACPAISDRRAYGEVCGTTDDCLPGLICSQAATCLFEGEPGTFIDGAACVTTAQCARGLACSSAGQCADVGAPGTAAFGEGCEVPADCQFGLQCADDTCRGLQVPLWQGADCPDPALETGPFRVYFEVPREDASADFYRFPYPNDARVNASGIIDLSGHPNPGSMVDLLGDVVGGVLRTASIDTGAFGNNQAVFLRFSDEPDFDSLTIGRPGAGTVTIVDITEGSAEYDTEPSMGFQVSTGRNAYICHNWLSLYPVDGQPWAPGHTYAVLIARGVQAAESGDTLARDGDFTALLNASSPGEGPLSHPWAQYAPLRRWLEARAMTGDELGAAVVFTVQNPSVALERLRTAVASLPMPPLHDALLCDGSPGAFADPGDPTRGCQSAAGDPWWEIQALVDLPQFQAGTPPFKSEGDGGNIDLSTTNIEVERTESVHVAITIPDDAPMPAGGWPVILYGHGSGGNYTSFIREDLAADLTRVALGAETVRFAMIGFDAPMHGPRSHPESWDPAWLEVDPDAYDPDVLFFNPFNAKAARDNPVQQAADTWALVALARGLLLPAASSPTGEEIRFNPSEVYYLGHSQGSVVGVTALAHDDGIKGAVLSAGGALTIQSLLHKTSPHDVAGAIRVGLADPNLDRFHPMLNIAQQVAERGDGVNHARYIVRSPIGGDAPRHIFQLFGVGDTYSPDETQYALTRSLGIPQVSGSSTPLERVSAVALPVQGNLPGGITGLVHLYENAGDDAHFVLFDRPDTIEHVRTFFAAGVLEGTPRVGD